MPKVPTKPIRYSVLGLGHIAQVAILPGFAHAKKKSRLTALVSGDRTKLNVLSRKYCGVATFSYDQFDECLEQVKAVAIPPFQKHLNAARRQRITKPGVRKPMLVHAAASSVDQAR